MRKSTISERTGKLLSGSAVNREKSFLSEVFRKAIRWGHVEDNLVFGIEGFSENKRERYITDAEFSSLLRHMKEDYQDLFLCIYHTAQRPGRIYTLQWSQVDLAERSIGFENTSDNKKVPELIWINDSLYAILTKRKRNRRTLSPFVFYRSNMQPYNDSHIRYVWNYAKEKAGVAGAVPYDLRHKAITDMKKAGHNDAFVGKVAGHSDPRTTKRYTHFSVDDTMAPLQALAKKVF
jgi:integrase